MTDKKSGNGTVIHADDVLHGEEARRRLGELIKGQRFALLTTADAQGRLGARPLTTQDVDFDGSIWFFVGASADWVRHFDGGTDVNVMYADPDHQRWTSISGRAELVDDREKVAELWNKANEAWFPGGVDDPDLRLMRVDVEHADFWDAPGSRVVRLAQMVKAVATGTRPDMGERGEIDLRG